MLIYGYNVFDNTSKRTTPSKMQAKSGQSNKTLVFLTRLVSRICLSFYIILKIYNS